MKYHSFIKNKRRNLLFVSTVLILLGSASCKQFLEVDFPKQLTPRDLVYSSDVSATSAVYGIYSTLYGIQGFASGGENSLMALTALSCDELTGDAQTNAATVQFQQNVLQADNTLVLALWKSMYQVIYQSNDVLEGLENSKAVTPATKKQLRGEALFMRAFCHFYLVNLFGDIPLVLTGSYEVNSSIKRSPAVDVYRQIEEDLLEAQKLLENNYPSKDIYTPAERIRVNSATATALLARLYLYIANWDDAETQATYIIENTELYELDQSADLDGIFVANSTEAIWQLKPFYNMPYTNEGYFFSRTGIDQFSNIMSSRLMDAFEITPAEDLRKTNWVKTQTDGTTTLHRPFKYKNIDESAAFPEYSMVFRLAEQYLIRAEARARLDKIDDSQDDLNAIRNRAGLGDTPAINQSELLAAIEQERRVELFAEWGHRWFDLKRWGRAQQVLGPIKPGFTAADEFYPIPLSEINKNPNLGR